MSNQFPSSINPAQLNPAVLQAFAAAQQASGGQLGSGNPNAVQAFNTFHSAFRKLQSAESQRLDQERLGISMPPQQQQQSQQSGLQGMSQQQFLQMMQQAGMMQPNGNTGVTGVGGGGNDQSSMMAYSMSGQQGMNGMNGTTGVNGMNNGGYGNMGMANMPNVAASMGGNMANMNNSNMPNMAMGNAAAANAFNIHSSQQGLNLPGMPENEQGRRQMLQNMLSQQLQNPQPAQQSQSQPNQQYAQPQQQSQNAAFSQQIRDFASKHPQAIADISRRVGDNQQALLAELTQMVANSQNMSQQQPQQLRQPSFNLDQMQQTYPAPSPQQSHQHQRIGSTDSYQFQGMSNGAMPTGAMQGAASIDYSKLDAAMKTARMVTPQMSANTLPLVSPNNSITQVTPQMQAQQLQQPQPLAPPPLPQRSSSQSVITGNSSATDVQAMLQTWGDKQLLKSTESLVAKINLINQNPGAGTPLDPSRYHLLQIIAEWKRRGQKPPEFALACAVQILGNPGVGAQLQHSDWATLANFAKARVDASNNNVRPDQQAPRQASGSQTNPIDMITPSLNATPQLGHQPLVPNAFQTPVNQPTGLQPAAPIAERQNSRGQQQQQQQPAPPSQPTQQAQQAQQLAQQQAQQQAQLQQAQQQAQQHAQQLQQQSLVQQQQVAQQQQQLHLQQANQQVQQWQQQQALQAQQAQQQQQQGQLQPNDPSSQQFRSSPQSSGGVPSAVAKSKPWLAMDFSKENIPIKEEPFMIYLGNMHMKTNEPLPAPMIDGKPVNLFNLFGLIHRNGGSTRVANNTQVWTFIGGMLGFGGEQTQQGQPTRSTPQVANQLRQMYAKFVAPLEDMFYAKLWKDKMRAQQQQNGQPIPNANLGRQLPPGAQGMTPQFLEAVSQVPGATLTDSQRKTLDEARRQSQSSTSVPTPPNAAQSIPAPPPMTPRSIHSAQMANNPGMVFQWVKIREDGTRSKFPKDAKNITEEDKPKVITELRGMLPAAREAQEKMPRFLMLAADRARDEITTLGTLVSMYMFVFLALQCSESGRFPFGIDDLGKIRDSLQNILLKFNNLFKQVASTPEGQLQIQRMNELLDSARPQSTSMPPPSSVAEDIASKLPKGLRVEDLKPPPAKRQKGAAGKASPAAATPEAKTPLGDSPVPPGSASSKKGGKRKRQESTSKPAAPQPAAARTPILPPPPPPPAKGNALGINLDVVEAEIQEHAPFFSAYNALRAPVLPVESTPTSTLDLSGNDEIWTQLIDAINGFQADPANHSVANAEVSSALNPMSTLNVNVNTSGPSRPTSTAGDDDWFEKFIDVSKMDESAPAWTLPTPELFRVNSRDEDDDTSPESIKTVGSTTGMSLKTPVISNMGLEKGEKEQVPVLGGFGSPEGAAYNGVFFGWDESSFNFVAAQ